MLYNLDKYMDLNGNIIMALKPLHIFMLMRFGTMMVINNDPMFPQSLIVHVFIKKRHAILFYLWKFGVF